MPLTQTFLSKSLYLHPDTGTIGPFSSPQHHFMIYDLFTDTEHFYIVPISQLKRLNNLISEAINLYDMTSKKAASIPYHFLGADAEPEQFTGNLR